MLKSEVAELLAVAAGVDGRKPTPLMVEAWFEVIGSLDYAAARRALVEHRRTSGEWLQPHHIVALVDVEEEIELEDVTAARMLAEATVWCQAHGVTLAELEQHRSDPAWIASVQAGREVTT